jgi:hypothetical protein
MFIILNKGCQCSKEMMKGLAGLPKFNQRLRLSLQANLIAIRVFKIILVSNAS